MEQYFIGLMLSSSANLESGVAVLDRNNEIILLDKLFSMNDVQHFFENFSSLKNSRICVSLPWDNAMLNGRWRIFSKPYQLVTSCDKFPNIDNWTQRFSNRGAEYLNSLTERGINVNRFDLSLTRQALQLESCFKERSPADCKTLQNALKIKYGFTYLLSNMMPMAQLEALVGAILAKKISNQARTQEREIQPIFEFNGIPVVRG